MFNSNPRPSPKKAKDDEAADNVDQSLLPAGAEDERDKECDYCGVTGARRKGVFLPLSCSCPWPASSRTPASTCSTRSAAPSARTPTATATTLGSGSTLRVPRFSR